MNMVTTLTDVNKQVALSISNDFKLPHQKGITSNCTDIFIIFRIKLVVFISVNYRTYFKIKKEIDIHILDSLVFICEKYAFIFP